MIASALDPATDTQHGALIDRPNTEAAALSLL
jgi:hypothetical protein